MEQSAVIRALAESCARRGVSAPQQLWRQLEAAYREPERYYHTLDHVRELLQRFAEVEAGPGWQRPREVILAILFHDAIYVVGRRDNEAKSAILAREAIARFWPPKGDEESSDEKGGDEKGGDEEGCDEEGCDEEPINEQINEPINGDRVAQLIELTAGHGQARSEALDSDSACFLDADMAILAAPEERFREYDAQIAREYQALPAEHYRAGRQGFFRGLLASEHIFHSEYFRTRYEARARANLRRALR